LLYFSFISEWFVRFALGPSLLGHRVRLFVNHPLTEEKGGSYQKSWNELPWQNSSKNANDCFDAYAEFRCFIAGPFRYVFLCDTDNFEDFSGSGYLQIIPQLTVGVDGHVQLPLNAIQCQTVLSKLLGPFEQWESRLRVSKECGYNMIHLSPIQTLGVSDSAYSISNHLELNPMFSTKGKIYTMQDVAKLVQKLHDEWQVLLISDVVWNHTAKNSSWLIDHPECAYNLENSPHLRPAFVLDRILYHFGREVADGKWTNCGIPKDKWEGYHLENLRRVLLDQVLPPHRLHEFFQVDVDKLGAEFASKIAGAFQFRLIDDCLVPLRTNLLPRLELGKPCAQEEKTLPLVIVQCPDYKRFGSTVDMEQAILTFNQPKPDCVDEQQRQWRCVDDFRACLQRLNDDSATRCWNHLRDAVNALLGHVNYERVADYGLKHADYESHHALLPKYFENPYENADLQTEEAMMYNEKAKHIMALNGWVMNDDPLKNFAEFPSKTPEQWVNDALVYFRRELICWDDSVKLRYGQTPEDCPFLWKYMTDYTELTAKTFYGFRLDNCHSTPLHVAEYLLEKARYIKPDLYVYAELFTRDENLDNLFINRLGITSIVREAQNAGDSHEEGRLVFRYGGIPVSSFFQRPIRPLMSRVSHAMFFDVTHDNCCPIQARTIYDTFPSAALVAMAGCAIGSNRGFDELVPYQIDVVREKRLYCSWTDCEKPEAGQVNFSSGMMIGRRAINDLHYFLGTAGFDEVYVDQITEDVVAVTRHNPIMHQSVILVSRTCFSPDKINRATVCQSEMVNAEPSSMSFMTDVEFVEFPPGSAIALRTDLLGLGFRMRSCSGTDLEKMAHEGYDPVLIFNLTDNLALALFQAPSLRTILSGMTLQDLNRVLFRCHEEEADEHPGAGAYYIPGVGNLVYCGLQGMTILLNTVRLKNDLGHPFCEHIRKGDWLVDYIADRLIRNHHTKDLGLWFKNMFELYKAVPYNLKPCYFDAIVSGSYRIIRETVWRKMSKFINSGSSFVRNLALASLAFCAYAKSAQLPQLSDKIHPPLPNTVVDSVTGSSVQALTSLSAGLPHFSCGLFRNWGRDTFIALPGILLITGRYDEARYTILAYAGCLRHGLIPNLLGGGAFARYNCRDAVWWWLYSIKCYTEIAPNGEEILSDTVRRLYPSDDVVASQKCTEQPLADTIQEAMQRHFEGISVRTLLFTIVLLSVHEHIPPVKET
uniref:Glycogen debrancher n=1 Tax=Soboliphyme baturini TaxID=241478 RepID=A0A183IQB6_9BILA